MLKNETVVCELLDQQRRALDHYFGEVDQEEVQAFVQRCLETKGLIVLTGIGKSGIIAEKIAATLVSTGTKALFLPPVNFLHGDLGVLEEEDALILISKSGETDELLSLVPFVRKRGSGLLAIVSNRVSRLAKGADLFVHLPVEKELCPFDLAPTMSTAIQLLFGDLLAISLMRAKEISLDEYAESHPSGSIGKRATVMVEEVMCKGDRLPLCRPEDKLAEVLVELSNKQCGCLLVTDEGGELLGIFTDGDLRRALQTDQSSVLEKSMGELMTPAALSVPKDVLAYDAMKVMQKDPKKWVMVLPILESKKVVGLLRMHDIIHAGIA